MKSQVLKSEDRGTKDIGWLKSRFSFSFSDYYHPLQSSFGTLVALNDDIVQPGGGFGTHPHVNMEIISVLLQGKMNHKDNLGYSTSIEPGGVQIMSAGSGIYHEEYNIGTDDVNFLQIWIQPKLQNIKPRYQTRSFPRADRYNSLKTIVSHEEGLGHCWINQNAKISLGFFGADTAVPYSLSATNKCLYILCIEGEIEIKGSRLLKRDAIGLWDTAAVDILCRTEAEFIVIETVINQK